MAGDGVHSPKVVHNAEHGGPRKLTGADAFFEIVPLDICENMTKHQEAWEAIIHNRIPTACAYKGRMGASDAVPDPPISILEGDEQQIFGDYLLNHLYHYRGHGIPDPEAEDLREEMRSAFILHYSLDHILRASCAFYRDGLEKIVHRGYDDDGWTVGSIDPEEDMDKACKALPASDQFVLDFARDQHGHTMPVLGILTCQFSELADERIYHSGRLSASNRTVYEWIDAELLKTLQLDLEHGRNKWKPQYTQILAELHLSLAKCDYLEPDLRPMKAFEILRKKYRADIVEPITAKALSGSPLPMELIIKVMDAWFEQWIL